MCLVVEKNQKVQIAKKDIEVYKLLEVVNKKFYSLYKNFLYKPGIHYYQTGISKINLTTPSWNGRHSQVSHGLHTFKYKNDARRFAKERHNVIVIKMIIPKGTEYYLGGFDSIQGERSYASNELIFPEKYEIVK
jgi:hypothetical protein